MHLICAFVSAYAKSRFFHDIAHLVIPLPSSTERSTLPFSLSRFLCSLLVLPLSSSSRTHQSAAQIPASLKMSHVMRKPVFRVSDQVWHKPAVQPQKMAGDLGRRGIVLTM